MSKTKKGKVKAAPELELLLNGEGTPVAEATWAVSDTVLQKVVKGDYKKPHVVVLVAERKSYETYDDEIGYTYYITDVYIRALSKAPKSYLRFRQPGDNIVVAGIIDVPSRVISDALEKAYDRPNRFSIDIDEQAREVTSLTLKIDDFQHFEFDSPIVKFVEVDPALFAPPPPRWQRALVTQYFANYAIDQCYFWRRLIVAGIATPIVQSYGLFARFFSLVYSLFMAKRNMNFRKLFALNPHDFGNSLGTSFWLKDKSYQDRRGIFWKLTPPWLTLYAMILAIAVAVFGGLPMLVLLLQFKDKLGDHLTWDVFWSTALVTDGILLASITFSFFVLTRKGRNLLGDSLRWFKDKLKPHVGVALSHKQQRALTISNERQRLAELIQRQSDQARAGEVQDSDFYLKAYAHKANVCSPYADGVIGN